MNTISLATVIVLASASFLSGCVAPVDYDGPKSEVASFEWIASAEATNGRGCHIFQNPVENTFDQVYFAVPGSTECQISLVKPAADRLQAGSTTVVAKEYVACTASYVVPGEYYEFCATATGEKGTVIFYNVDSHVSTSTIKDSLYYRSEGI